MNEFLEIWKPILGYENLYEISNLGRVKRLDSYIKCKLGLRLHKGRILKTLKNNYGYLAVELYKQNKCKRKLIHRLVAEHFLENQNKFSQVNHRDFNPENNTVTNLEWVSASANQQYSSSHNRVNPWLNKNRRFKLTPEQVKNLKNSRLLGLTFKELGRLFDISDTHACNIVNNKNWRTPNA